MKQYCRYCSYLCTGNGIYCDKQGHEISEAQAKRINHCKDFEIYEGPAEFMDAFGENLSGYKPRQTILKVPDGQMELEL